MSNKIKAFAAVSAFLITISGCSNNNISSISDVHESSSTISDSLGGEDLESEPKDYSSEIEALTIDAWKLANTADRVLATADTYGCIMKDGDGALADISIIDGVWNAKLSSTIDFGQCGGYYWKKESGAIKKGDTEEYNFTARLCIDLMEECPNIKNGHIGIYIHYGDACALYYTESTEALPELADCMSADGWNGSYEWGECAGVTKDGIVVATCPTFEG